MDPTLGEGIAESALAFRGYNVTNLGRTAELLAVPAYRTILLEELRRFSEICGEIVAAPVDLAMLVEEHREPGLEHYAGSVALIVAVEVAQLRLLREIHGVDCRQARSAFGYSLGELMAVCCSGGFKAEELVRVPLAMAHDCAVMAHEITMGVLFSRGGAIAEEAVKQLCAEITSWGRYTIGVSSILSPNTYLLIGQGDTVEQFKATMGQSLSPAAHLRINSNRWPPLHTPIVRQRHIPDRSAVMMEKLTSGEFPLRPPVVSLVTGKRSYERHNARDLLRQWIDRPQRLWDAVCDTLSSGAETVIHIGPEPNLVPATFTRLSDNVLQQNGGRSAASLGRRAVSRLVKRQWLAALLPARAALLRAPYVKQVILEDWLLAHAPK